jgi:AraC family transcriptional regulator
MLSVMADLAAPRSEEFGPVSIAGLGQRYNDETSVGIPALWQRFVPHIGHIPGQIGGKTYGVEWSLKGAEGFEYVCGVEVSDLSAVPAEFSQLTLEKQKYAVFSHTGHISTIRDTWGQIWNQWRTSSGVRIASTPRIEIYSETFNPSRPGGVEIWIPVEG